MVLRGTGRERLLQAAKTELVERAGALEIASVAARARVSVGLVYRHYGSRAGLVAAVVEDFYDRLDASVIEIDPDADADWMARERMRLELAVRFFLRDPLARVILARLDREPESAAVEARRITRHVDTAERNIRRAQEQGLLAARLDARLAGAMTLGGLRLALQDILSSERRPTEEAVVDGLWRMTVATLRYGDR